MTDRDARPEGTRTIEAIQDDFRGRDYIADRSLATAVFLALKLRRPLFLEGEAGMMRYPVPGFLCEHPDGVLGRCLRSPPRPPHHDRCVGDRFGGLRRYRLVPPVGLATRSTDVPRRGGWVGWGRIIS